jgi:alpha-tubulin suppressor-like RCC1 family protein
MYPLAVDAAKRPARRLPPGSHGIPADLVARNQRERLIAAMAEECAEVGYAEASRVAKGLRVAGCLAALAVFSALAWVAQPALGSSPDPSPGELYGFGNNRFYQLGSETNAETQEPNPTPLLATLPGQAGPVLGAAGGEHHSLAVTESGQLYSFGYNFYGQLGTSTNAEYTFDPPLPPEQVTLPGEDGPVTQTVAGCDFSLAVTGSGQLYAFGENQFGQLGNSTNIEEDKANPTPTLVTLPGATGGVVEAAAGCFHTLALTSTGQLYAFGHNSSGELGYERSAGPGENAHPTPTLVTLPGQVGGVVQIAAGGAGTGGFTLALTESGQLYAFGDNRFGQLGFAENSGPGPNPSENAHPIPTLVTLPGEDGPVVQVAAGNFHSLALTESGQLYAFGSNRFGELGNTTNNGNEEANPTPTPVALPGARARIARIAAGYEDSFALTSAGQLYAFGWNYYGQLGRQANVGNSPASNPAPTQVAMPGGAAVATVAASTDHTLVTIGMLLTTSSLPDGTVGEPYEAEVQTAGGEAPYQWSATGLPPGLSIDPASGEISGTPANAACGHATCHYAATFTAIDGNGMQASLPLSIAVGGNTYPLRVTTGGSGAGEVSSSPAGIEDCGSAAGTCEASYVDGAKITLTAQPAAGSTFTGWSGGGCAGTETCRVTLNADTVVTANFSEVPLSPPQPLPASFEKVSPAPPDTRIVKERIGREGRAAFRFEAIGRASGFQCARVRRGHGEWRRKAHFKRCSSPKRYAHLKKGRYVFIVRAFDSAGKDPTPAKRKFKIAAG